MAYVKGFYSTFDKMKAETKYKEMKQRARLFHKVMNNSFLKWMPDMGAMEASIHGEHLLEEYWKKC